MTTDKFKKKQTKEEQDCASLKAAKDIIKRSHDNFRASYINYHKNRNFLFKQQITDGETSKLKALNKPPLQFNVLMAPISRLRGEFSKQEPSICVSRQEDVPMSPQIGHQIEIVEGHTRHILSEARKNNCAYNVYTDQLSGGFSVMKVWTEYSTPWSFTQVIKMDRVYDPTLCGFDPLARLSNKSDGRYCFEIYPKSENDFKIEFPKVNTEDISYKSAIEEFSFAYKTEREKIILVCDLYEKKKKQVEIVKISTGETLELKKYKSLLKEWAESSVIVPAPEIISQRTTDIVTIVRTRFIENQILECIETDYKDLPLVFVDGNSALLRESIQGPVHQHTKAYFEDAIGAQKLKNYAGQTWAGYIESMVQHKWKIAVESINPNYTKWVTQPQIGDAVVYNAFLNNDSSKPIPAPQEVGLIPMPPEISNAFNMADQTIQQILGAFDSSMGKLDNNQLSGLAVIESTTQSNSAAMPYIVSYLQALEQCAIIIVDLIPKYYVEKNRNITVLDKEGNAQERMINSDPNTTLKYEENAFRVKVEAGVNFNVQKTKALQSMTAMMAADPQFSQFMVEEGLTTIMDNMEFRGVDILKEKAEEWMKRKEQERAMQAQMAQQAMQNDPRFIKAKSDAQKAQAETMKIQHEIQHSQIEDQQFAVETQLEQLKAENERLSILAGIQESERNQLVREEQMQTDRSAQAAKLLIEASKHRHEVSSSKRQHDRDDVDLLHKVNIDHKKLAGEQKNAIEKRKF